MLAGLMALLAMPAAAVVVDYQAGVDYGRDIRIDRYLSVEVWTDNSEYYEGDKINISFRANRDCFVAVYNIDTRGNVNLIYPSRPEDDVHIQGGRTYRVPAQGDDYELTVKGPAGIEYLQIIASREPIPIPDWFSGSDLVCSDDPYDFIDYINAAYFGCEDNCTRALDLTSFEVKEWHEYYFRPVYDYNYPDWSLCGSVYIDYPFGATIYIDGVYWGVAPLYIPRIFWGWHYFTIYDPYGYCWEDRVSIVRYRSVVLDQTIVRTRADVKSRYREVRDRGYLDPVRHGYPDYQKDVKIKETYKAVTKGGYDAGVGKSTRTVNGKARPLYQESGSKKSSGSYNNKATYQKHEVSRDGNQTEKRTYERSKKSGDTQRTYSTPRSTAGQKASEGKKQSSGTRSGGDKVKQTSKPASSPAKSSEGKSQTSDDDGSKKGR